MLTGARVDELCKQLHIGIMAATPEELAEIFALASEELHEREKAAKRARK